MTIALYSRTSWREVDTDFTVGQTDGEFAGTVERVDGRFLATTSVGVKLGSFRSADAAQRALEDAAESGAGRTPVGRWQLPVIIASLATVCATALTAVVSL